MGLSLIPCLKTFFQDAGLPIDFESVKGCMVFYQLIDRARIQIKDVSRFLDGQGCRKQLARFRPIDLFVAELLAIPFLKTVQHDPHFTANKNDFEAPLFYKPIRFDFLHAEKSLHFRDRDACLVHVDVPPM